MTEKLPTVGLLGDLTSAPTGNQTNSPAFIAGRAIADAGCNILTMSTGAGMNQAAKAFSLTPYRVGKSIGIKARPSTPMKAGRRRIARKEPEWIDISLVIPDAASEPRSLNDAFLATADIVMVVTGGEETKSQLESAIAYGKPIIALLGKGQKIGTYGARTAPSGVKVVKNEKVLRDELSSRIAPFALAKPTFASLKAVYKTDASDVHACSMEFPNTCAIRMSEALSQVVSGIKEKFRSSGLNVCPHDFMRGAQDLASVLRKADVFGTYDQGFAAPMNPPPSIRGKTGIVCYMNIPTYPDGQGHIDLWDDDGPVGSSYWAGNPIWFWRLD